MFAAMQNNWLKIYQNYHYSSVALVMLQLIFVIATKKISLREKQKMSNSFLWEKCVSIMESTMTDSILSGFIADIMRSKKEGKCFAFNG